jgi:PAS domain S-box-containing protein
MDPAHDRQLLADRPDLVAFAFETAGVGVWTLQCATEEMAWSPMVDRLFGHSLGEQPATIEDLLRGLHPDDRKAFRRQLDSVRATGERSTVETRLADSDRWLTTTMRLRRDDTGQPVELLGVVRDTTEQKQYEAELKARIKQLDQFASMVSHDLRNPCSSIRAKVMLYEETGDPERLQGIESEVERIEEIVTDMLTLAQSGSVDSDTEPCSLRAVATESWDRIDTQQATLSVETDLTVEADRSQLRSLFENLFKNSVGHGGGDVTVIVDALADHAGFAVSDTGSGIPADIRDAVFDHGFSTGYGGTGTGLTIIGHIADAHGWTVDLTESNSGGARFEFTI